MERLAREAGATVISPKGANGECIILCRRESLADAVNLLRTNGVTGAVAAEPAAYVFGETNPPMQRLEGALKR